MLVSMAASLFALLLLAQAPAPLPPWTPGTLDIHTISTGRGESSLLILPDGTSLMIDAGDLRTGGPPRISSSKPDASRRPGEWIARYARHMLRHDAQPALDYFLLTHLHSDHMGEFRADLPMAKSQAYRLTGVTELTEHLPIRQLLDRGWPGYDWPAPMKDPAVDNYRAFVKWQAENRQMKAERFAAGRNDQIVLRRDRAKYPNFEIRNVAVNGEVWTGVGANTVKTYPPLESLKPEEYPRENPSSCALRVSYGAFDYFSGGDLSGDEVGAEPWRDMEAPVARAIGPTDVIKLNHHGNQDSTTAFFLRTVRPRVFIIPAWSSDHPGQTVLTRLYSERIYPGPRDGFATNMLEANKIVIGPLLSRLKSDQGHIVVRVAPGGASYRIYILDDSAETYTVKAEFGPYESR